MNIVSVAVSAQVKVSTFSATKENASDAGLLAAVTDYVLVSNTDLSVVDHYQVVLALISYSIVRSVA